MTTAGPPDHGPRTAPGDDAGTEAASTGTGLTLDQQVGHYVDMWKQTVTVQIHFNDIAWRIRSLALTAATFALGAAGVATKDGTKIGPISLGSLIITIGLLLWYAFYFVDRVWYHTLLRAAVQHGTRIEEEIKKALPQAGMTAAITEGSIHHTNRLEKFFSRKATMQSDDKLRWFYKVGAAALVTAAIALQIGTMVGTRTTSTTEPPVGATPTVSHTAR
jgi:hypothetical protein